MKDQAGDVQARADELLASVLADLEPAEAVYAASVVANRAATELHKRVRAEAVERRGSESWGAWAALQNGARNLVLTSSTCRDGAARLVGRKR